MHAGRDRTVQDSHDTLARQQCMTPSWKDVVRALEHTNQLALAEIVKQKYLLSTTTDQGECSMVVTR